jgi:plastocyanin
MIPLRCRHTLHTTLGLAFAAAAFGCDSAPAPASPASGPRSAASPADSSRPDLSFPRIVGVVFVSTTRKAPTNGGVVFLEDAPKRPVVATTATINVEHKEFTPFISVIATGGTVIFGNEDALTHHVFSPDVPSWDTGYLKKNDTAARTFDSPGPIALLCNIHPEMLGYLLVIPSTYFGKLGPSGEYAIADVPPGKYRATAWSPRLPTATQSVTVGPTEVVTANFELLPAGTTN